MRVLLGIPHVPSEAFMGFLEHMKAECDLAVLLWYENPWVLRVLRRRGVRVYFDNILSRAEPAAGDSPTAVSMRLSVAGRPSSAAWTSPAPW